MSGDDDGDRAHNDTTPRQQVTKKKACLGPRGARRWIKHGCSGGRLTGVVAMARAVVVAEDEEDSTCTTTH